MNRDFSLFRHFGLNSGHLYWGPGHKKYQTAITNAVMSRRMACVVGGFGSGKSTLVRETLNRLSKVRVVYVNTPDREKMTIANIQSAVIYELTNEAPKRDRMARLLQLSRIIGLEVKSHGREVVLVLDNAHRLHTNTILALKDLREAANFKGHESLFSVILVGQESLPAKIASWKEVRYRTLQMELDQEYWMDQAERMNYLAAIYGRFITDEARQMIAAYQSTPLQMDFLVDEIMRKMKAAGETVLGVDQLPSSLAEMKELLKVTLRDLEKITGIPKSTIGDVISGKNNDGAKEEVIRGALEGMVRDRSGSLQKVGS